MIILQILLIIVWIAGCCLLGILLARWMWIRREVNKGRDKRSVKRFLKPGYHDGWMDGHANAAEILKSMDFGMNNNTDETYKLLYYSLLEEQDDDLQNDINDARKDLAAMVHGKKK